MITKEALRAAIITSKLFDEMEGCIELPNTQPSDTYIGQNTVVFMDNEYQPTCINANAREGYVKRLKTKKWVATSKSLQANETENITNTKNTIEETVKGDVLVLFCSEKVLKLLKHDHKRRP